MQLSSADEYHAVGRALAFEGLFRDAEAKFRLALNEEPGRTTALFDLGLALMAQGRYREGFPYYAARFGLAGSRPKPRLPYPEWQGEPLKGRNIALFPEQGLGDQIQIARFAPVLRKMGADVTLFCDAPLQRLFEGLGTRTIAASGAVEFPDPDYLCMIMDLPGKLRSTLQTLPSTPYLSATPRPMGARIGVARRGKATHANDARRSLPDDLVLPFEALELSPEVTGAKDFQDTADIIAGLDLVVSVDTSIAHLAGALGKPCWLLLPRQGIDWRWMANRTDSPWYPSMRLYRQEVADDWVGVLKRVATDLEAQ